MSGECLEKLPHSCGTSDGLQVFARDDGSVDGYCFSCSTYVRHPYTYERRVENLDLKPKKSEEEIQEEIQELLSCSAQNLPSRQLKKASLEHFDVRVGLSRKDGKTPEVVAFPYKDKDSGEIVAFKLRLLERKISWWIGDTSNIAPFGWFEAIEEKANTLIITEGEFDALAATTIIKRYGNTDYQQPVFISVPHGAGQAPKFVKDNIKEWKRYFKEIVLMFDGDSPGQRAVEQTIKLTGENLRTIDLPKKDANDCLVQGLGKQAHDCIVFRKEHATNSKIVWGDTIHEQAKQPAKWGLSWPWPTLTEKTRGLRFGETYYFGAGVKLGKSELLNALASHLIQEHRLKVFLVKPEEANNKTYKLMCGKVVGKVFHDPKVEFDEEAYEEAGEILKDSLCMMDLYQNISWGTLKEAIHDAASQGCRAVFIDPITNLTNGMPSGEANVELQRIAQESSALAKDLDLMVFLFCHLKAPENGPPHEKGGEVLSTQFAGSRAMMRSCNYMMGLEGNKSEELNDYERNIRYIRLLEDREFGEVGSIKLFWDRNTTLFKEIKT